MRWLESQDERSAVTVSRTSAHRQVAAAGRAGDEVEFIIVITGDAVRNRRHADCHVAVERAADRYTLICDGPLTLRL